MCEVMVGLYMCELEVVPPIVTLSHGHSPLEGGEGVMVALTLSAPPTPL